MQYSASSTIAINKFGWSNYNYFLNKHLGRVILGLFAMALVYNFEIKWCSCLELGGCVSSWSITYTSRCIFCPSIYTNGQTS